MPETQPTVLILTALALEYAAVRPYIEDREERVHHDGTRVEIGLLPDSPWRVAISELGVGAERTASLATQLIEWLKPQAVFFVGVAGGLKSDIGIGDVVVGTQVYEIHGGKQTSDGFKVRPRALPSSHALEQAARSAARDLDDVEVHFAPIATGDVVLADSESGIARFIESHYNDAGAIEMEGSGAANAARFSGQLDALVIRGVSDHANAAKPLADAGGSQKLAATQAASVTMAVLRKHLPRGRGSADSEEGPQERHRGDHIDFRGGIFYGPVTGKQAGGR